MSAERADTSALQPPLGQLERALIDEFVRARGYDPLKLADLPEQEREKLLKEASVHASARLTEVESRSHFVHEIHDGVSGIHKTGL
jgi:hypothetical protein